MFTAAVHTYSNIHGCDACCSMSTAAMHGTSTFTAVMHGTRGRKQAWLMGFRRTLLTPGLLL